MGIACTYDKYDYLDYKCPKQGEITKLIISKNVRNKGIGQMLMQKMEEALIVNILWLMCLLIMN